MNEVFRGDQSRATSPRRHTGVLVRVPSNATSIGGMGRAAIAMASAVLFATGFGCAPHTRDNPVTCVSNGECESNNCDTINRVCNPVDAAMMMTGGSGGGGGGGHASGGSGTGGNGGGMASGGRAGATATGGAAGTTTSSGGRGGTGNTDGGVADVPPSGCSPACTNPLPICNFPISTACRACAAGDGCPMPTPYCNTVADAGTAGQCVECLSSANCGATAPTLTRPICTNNACVACTSNAACMGKDITKPVCLTAAGATMGSCVQCNANTDCSNPNPICDLGSHTCMPCAASGALACPSPRLCIVAGMTDAGSCVQCLTNANCSGTTPICNAAHTCVGCTGTTCPAGLPPVCVPMTNPTNPGSCVGCLANADCTLETSPICNTATTSRTCTPCATNAQCLARNTALPVCVTGAITGAGSCVGCLASSDCPGATPICNTTTRTCRACASDTDCTMKDALNPACILAGTGAGTCVPCTASLHCNRATTAPICDTAAHTCVRCTTDTQCVAKSGTDPGVCMFHSDGHCATPAEVGYVRPGSPGVDCSETGTGLVTLPYCTIQSAVATATNARPIVVIRPGTAPLASWVYPSGASPPPMLTVIGQNPTPIGPAGGNGVAILSGDVYIRGVTISGMTGLGISVAAGATIRLDRCIVTGNVGGLAVNGGVFQINNSVFASNMGATAPVAFGGISLNSGGAAGAVTEFRNNTIFQNGGVGLVCAGAYATRGLFVANNIGGQVTTCLTDNTTFNGGTTVTDPMFAAGSFHWTAGSPCVNFEPLGTTDFPADDLDGAARPNPAGARVDCGADEL